MTKAELAKQSVGVVAFVLNVWGNLELTKQTNRGHVIRLFSNACWLIYSPLVGAWALFLNHSTFAGINVLGYYRWHKIQAKASRSGHCERCRQRESELGARLERQT